MENKSNILNSSNLVLTYLSIIRYNLIISGLEESF